jgi:hypothetical protein
MVPPAAPTKAFAKLFAKAVTTVNLKHRPEVRSTPREQNTKVGEGRKRVILIAASILAARKLAQFDPDKRVPATMCTISDSVGRQIMEKVMSVGRRGMQPTKNKGRLRSMGAVPQTLKHA